MKLVHARIRRYRSIEEPTEFDVEGDVTCLVGKNESGKTATLQALYKSQPIATASFDEGLDYPSHKSRELLKSADSIEVTTLSYGLDDEDVIAVERELGKGPLSSRTVKVTFGYRFSARTWSVQLDQGAIVEHLRKGVELPPTAAEAANKATTISELVAALESLEAQTAASQAVLTRVKNWRKQNYELKAIDILR